MCLFESQILFGQRAGTVGVNNVNNNLKRVCLVAIVTILSRTFKNNFLFASAITLNLSFFALSKQVLWSILG